MPLDRVLCILRHATACKSEANPQELALPFNCGGSEAGTQAIRPTESCYLPPEFFKNYILNVPFCCHP